MTPNPDVAAALAPLGRTAFHVSQEPDPDRALSRLVCALRADLNVDRAGVFEYDPEHGALVRVVGVSEDGNTGGEALSMDVARTVSPIARVARREIPWFLTQDIHAVAPEGGYPDAVRALALAPMVSGNVLVGVLSVENVLNGRAISDATLQALHLYAALGTTALASRSRRRERERMEADQLELYRNVFLAATAGRLRLCEARELAVQWARPGEGTLREGPLPVDKERDIWRVREAVRSVCGRIAMDVERAADLELCVCEAATNALQHGRGGFVEIAVECGRVCVRISDQGQGIAWEDLPRAALHRGWTSADSAGVGFTLIIETADCVRLCTGPEGTTLIREMAVSKGAGKNGEE